MNTYIHYFANGTTDLEADISALSINVVLIASVILVVLLGIATQVANKKKFKNYKKPLFALISLTIIIPSLIMMGSTVYINTISESKGPVHWHTDIELWVCGEEIELRNPTGFLSNKIGTSTYHEHDDKRIHLEGVVVEKDYDASLEKFFDVIGGDISESTLSIPTESTIFENDLDGDTNSGNRVFSEQRLTTDSEGMSSLVLNNGDGSSCNDVEAAQIQAFLYRYEEETKTYTQTKLENPKEYIMRDESIVPPGDCVIVEYDSYKLQTDKLCKQYGVRDSDRCTEFGVTTFNPKLCFMKQTYSTEGGQ